MALTGAQADEVKELIKKANENMAEQFGNFLKMGEAQVAEVKAVVENHNNAIRDNNQRITDLVNSTNASFGVQHQKTETALAQTQDLDGRVQAALAQTQDLDGRVQVQFQKTEVVLAQAQDLDTRMKQLVTEMDAYADRAQAAMVAMDNSAAKTKTETMEEFVKMRQNIETWFDGLQARAGSGGEGPPRGSGGGAFRSSVDKKEIAVWKLPEDVDKINFRHWLDSVDMQLEMVHNFKHANILLNRIRRSATEIDADTFTTCVFDANKDALKAAHELGVDDDGGISEGRDYVFQDKTKFLNAYLIPKINSELHSKTSGIE